MVVNFVSLHKYKKVFLIQGMILRTLKITDYRAWIYLLIFSALTGIFALVFDTRHEAVFSNSVLSFVPSLNSPLIYKPLWMQVIGLILLMSNVILFDHVLTSQEVVEKNNHVPAFLMGMYLVYPLQEHPLHPQLLAQLLLTFSYQRFISTYRLEKAGPRIFDGAFCLSCAVIIYPPYWVFFALGFICLAVLRSFTAREYSLVIIGIALPYLFYYTILFLCDLSLQKPVSDIVNSFHRPRMPIYLDGSFLVNFTTVVIVLFTGIFFLGKQASGKMKTQKALTIFLWALIPCLAAIFLTNNHFVFTGQMAIMPLSLFTGIYFGSAKRRTFAEVLLLLLTVAILLSTMQHAELEVVKFN
jgi:hypothetical protein